MLIIESNLEFNLPAKGFKLNDPKNIIIHHALAKRCTIWDIHRWHLDNGWFGYAYHFFVNKDGGIYRGRPDLANGGHTKEQNMNRKSLGICLEGCYQEYKNQTDTEVPSKQLNALIELIKFLMVHYAIPVEKVFPHHYFANYKLCPGNYFPWDSFIKKIQIIDYETKYYELLKNLKTFIKNYE